jgi:hypothetical protein
MADPHENLPPADATPTTSEPPNSALTPQPLESKKAGSAPDVNKSASRAADRFGIFEELALERLRAGTDATKPASFLPLPVRLTAVAGAVIASLGVAWSVFTRVPVQVNGIAVIVPPGGLESLDAPTSGVLQYQVSGSGPDTLTSQHREINSMLRGFWLGQATVFTNRVNDSSRLRKLVEAALQPTQSQDLVLATNQTNSSDNTSIRERQQLSYPNGTIIARIENTSADQTLNSSLLGILPAVKQQSRQGKDRLSRAGQLSQLGKLQTKQRQTLLDELKQRRGLYQRYFILWKQGFLPATAVYEEQSRINSLESQLLNADSSQVNTRINSDEQLEQFRQTNVANIDNLNRLENDLINYLTTTAVIAPAQGFYILTRNFNSNSLVRQGDELITFMIQPPSLPKTVPLFLNSASAQQVSEGMPVLVTPRGISRAQYGGIRGKVVEVNKLPLQGDGLQGALGSRGLVNSIQQIIPNPYLVRIQLEQTNKANCQGPSRYNCYPWSSHRLPPHPVRLATLADVHITTRDRSPFEFVMPAIRDWLGMVVDTK